MADIARFRRNTAAVLEGVRVQPGPEWDDLELRVRPGNPAYDDALSRAKSDLVRQARADGRLKPREGYEQLPISERLALGNALCLKMLFIEPYNLTIAGKPVDAAKYRELAQTEEFADLMDAVWAGVEIATTMRQAQTEGAGGNSPAPSPMPFDGAALQP
ncbi:hypothetical protein [Roseomonas sp. USHLN139]|uniref:hypothetical protein n=1 Tax=Roseomonas sp. USHLN139 TaxID=3081298 RepID=UPI003B02CB89